MASPSLRLKRKRPTPAPSAATSSSSPAAVRKRPQTHSLAKSGTTVKASLPSPAAVSSSPLSRIPLTDAEREERRVRRRERKAAWKAKTRQEKEETKEAAAPIPHTHALQPKKNKRRRVEEEKEAKPERQPEESQEGEAEEEEQEVNDGAAANEEEEEKGDAKAVGGRRQSTAPSGEAKLMKNPLVYLDLAIEDRRVGRVIIELYEYASPRTVANFRALCSGEKGMGVQGKPLHYAGTPVHRVVPSFVMQMGDIIHGDGSGGESIYGRTFPHEPNHRRHRRFGSLSTAAQLHSGARPSSQFFISLSHEPLKWLDGKHTVFGQVVRGAAVLKEVERLAGTKGGQPKQRVTISASGNYKKKQRREEEEETARRREVEQQAKATRTPPPVALCERCSSVCRYNKKTRRGVRMRCINERCGHAQWAPRLDWTEEQRRAFDDREEKRKAQESEELRAEEEAADAPGQDGDGDEDDGEQGEDEGDRDEREEEEAFDEDASPDDSDEDDD